MSTFTLQPYNSQTREGHVYVKWEVRGLTRTGTLYGELGNTFNPTPCVFIIQNPGVLTSDGTREERCAKREAYLASCTTVADGDTVNFDGKTWTLKYQGDFAATFTGVAE